MVIVRALPALDRVELLVPIRLPWVVVPAGFVFDGASIPRIAWTALGYTPFHPKVLRAAAVHDFLYEHKLGTRRAADERFLELLLEDGVEEHAARAMHIAVRQFGCLVWMDADDIAERAALLERERVRQEDAP